MDFTAGTLHAAARSTLFVGSHCPAGRDAATAISGARRWRATRSAAAHERRRKTCENATPCGLHAVRRATTRTRGARRNAAVDGRKLRGNRAA